MNTMQMNGMQPGQPGGAMMMQQPSQQAPNGIMGGRPADKGADNTETQKMRLNTAIYDYFLKMGQYDMARALKNSSLIVKTGEPSLKRKADDEDNKDDPNRPGDLQPAGFPLNALSSDTAFLLDWFSIFFDLFLKDDKNPVTSQYLQHTQNLNRLTQQQQQTMMRQSMMPNNPQMMMRNTMMMRNGQNMMTPQQQQQMMNRQRLIQANAMAQERQQMDVDGMTPQQMQNFSAQNQQRANMGGQGSPNMMNPGMDMQAMQGGNGDFYNNGNLNRANVNGQNGHALQDYQQQLMLLERQNRKRLELAKQEQEGSGYNGQNGNMPLNFAPNMSPSGSRQGPSPNPSEQMKRGTPQIPKGNMPGSPMPDGGPRASPSAMNYNGMGPGMENGMRAGANGMQPPSSHPNFQNGGPGMNPQQMQAMRNAQVGPMPGGQGFQPGQQGPMAPGNQQPGANGQMGTPRQGNAAMPPPQGVPPNQNATGRAPSPAPSAAANTPQTTNKPNPKKGKKDTKDRKPSTKKTNNAAATPAENADAAPPTSTPATPITPAVTNANNAAFDKNKTAGNAQANGAPVASAPQQVSQPAAPTVDMGHGQDAPMMSDFGTDLDFAGLEAGDVLDQFNFDAFIEDGNGNLDNFNFDMGGFDGGMEAGIGEA